MNNQKIFRKEFYLNEYELKEKRLSLTNFLLYYDIDFILNNDIVKHFELEFLNYNDFVIDKDYLEKELSIEDILIFIQNNNSIDFENYLNYSFDFDLITYDLLKDMINNYDFDLDYFLNDLELELKDYFDLNYDPYFDLDIFQYYIIKENDKELFEKYTDYPIFYCNDLDLYLIGITHYNMGFNLIFTQKSFTNLYIIDKSTNKKVYFNGIENYSFKW